MREIAENDGARMKFQLISAMCLWFQSANAQASHFDMRLFLCLFTVRELIPWLLLIDQLFVFEKECW
jgi:hypothetical protein